MATNGFTIREHQLDQDWLIQPTLTQEFCEKLADAKKSLNLAKQNLELVEAEMDREVRLHPSRHGLDKTSEARVKSAVVVSAPYQKAYKELIERQHDCDVLQAAVTALEHKKRALENLVHLYAMSYYSKPQTDEDNYDALREAQRGRDVNRKRRQ